MYGPRENRRISPPLLSADISRLQTLICQVRGVFSDIVQASAGREPNTDLFKP